MSDDQSPRCDHCNTVYRERAQLLQFVVSLYPAVISYNDSVWPEYPVLYVKTPAGQLSWHLSSRDLDLFPDVQVVDPRHEDAAWDGHSTDEKYARLAELARDNRKDGLPHVITPSEPDPPQSGADHFHTAEMHGACARTYLTPEKDETGEQRADRLAQFDGHLGLAIFHQGMASTLIDACKLSGVESTQDEVASWSIFLAARIRAGQAVDEPLGQLPDAPDDATPSADK